MRPNYSTNIMDRLANRAEARRQRIVEVRELGGLPPQVTPGRDYESYYRFPQEGDLTEYYSAAGRSLARSLDARTFEGLWDDRTLQELHEHSYYQVFGQSEEYFRKKVKARLYQELMERFNLQSVRKRRLEKDKDITNKDAKFLLENDY